MLTSDLLKEKFSELNYLKVVDERERGKTLFDATILYPHTISLDEDIKNKITDTIKSEHLDKDVKVVFKKSFLDEPSLALTIMNYINEHFFVIQELINIENAKIDDEKAKISFVFSFDNSVADYVRKNEVISNLQNYLDNNYHYEFEITSEMSEFENDEPEEKTIVFEDTSYFKPRVIEIKSVERLLGDQIKVLPLYIKDIQSTGTGVCISGKIVEWNELQTKERKDAKGKIVPPKPYFRWTVEDFTGKMNVLSFCSETNLTKIRKLAVGSQIVMVGDVDEDSFNKGFIFKPKHISFCEFPEHFEEIINYKRVPEQYRAVEIVPANVINQMDLFTFAGREQPEYIKNHTIVVYDFETTGLSSSADSVIEIGALKIVGGEYTDQFQTFIKCDKPLPKEITELTTITDADLKDAPLPEDVFADFYKFCDGAVLCGYNSDNFDLNFLKRYWKKYQYEFKHETLDCYKLATKIVRGLKKYTLSSIADALKIQLYNAHRALADATATAEILLTIANQVLSDKEN